MFRSCLRASLSEDSHSDATQERFVPVEPPVPRIPVLVEVVGATNFLAERLSRTKRRESLNSLERNPPNPFCVVSVEDEVVHTTQTISKDDNPIWTVKTKSLCIIHIPDETGKNVEQIKASDSTSTLETCLSELPSSSSFKDGFTAEVFNGTRSLGQVKIDFERILQCKGERMEFPIAEDWQSCRTNEEEDTSKVPQSTLALRFRRATPEDIEYVRKLEQQEKSRLISSAVATARDSARTLKKSFSALSTPTAADLCHGEEATDVDFRQVVTKDLLVFKRKKEAKTGDTLVRLQPPLRNVSPEEEPVEWLTKAQIQEVALQPSTKWIETGDGDAGTLYLEIIGCDDLPSMDLDGLADPFVGVVFENTFVRTKVLFDTLCPRWLPWSTRAFAINITHPGSMIFLGCFDYTEVTDLKVSDCAAPVGRVVINTINFESAVTYLLHYDLKDSSQIDTPRGTITVRLRLEWKNENDAAKLALLAPPRFIVNVETEKSWHVLHYCTYGAINMDKPSMSSVKLYWNEVYDLWKNYCYFLDVVVNLLLWRGWARFSVLGYTANVWFPIQSVWLFVSVALAYEKPAFAPAIFFYGIAWIMLSLNYYNSRHSYYWQRVKKFESLVMGLRGSPVSCTETVKANAHFEEFYHYQQLDALKAERMMALLYALLTTGLKGYRIYSGTCIANVVDTTEDTSWYFMAGKLYYPHMLLKYICKYGRSFRNFIHWESYASFPKTVNLLILGSICLITPLHPVATVIGRILVCTLLGPGMKILDVAFVSKYYKTNEQLMDDIVNGRVDRDYWFLVFFDSIIEHDVFRSMRKSGRLVAERAAKLKDIRESLYGEWSELVPWVDNSRRPSVPLPRSSAKPWNAEDELSHSQGVDWKFNPGKKLVVDMIPKRPDCNSSRRRINEGEIQPPAAPTSPLVAEPSSPIPAKMDAGAAKPVVQPPPAIHETYKEDAEGINAKKRISNRLGSNLFLFLLLPLTVLTIGLYAHGILIYKSVMLMILGRKYQ